jgi:transposase
MGYYAGLDLHSNNTVIGIIDEKGKRVYKRKVDNFIQLVWHELEPFKDEMIGVVVESTFNWYWLVDGMMEAGYKLHLANPSAIKQYEGLKHTDDYHDAFHLANLLRLGILPEGYIYPREKRPIRDLLRKRLMLVRHRTAHILSFQSLYYRHTGSKMSSVEIKRLREEEVEGFFDDPHIALASKSHIAVIAFLSSKIKEIELATLKLMRPQTEFKKLTTVYGIGEILALTIMLETGPISRFPKVGNYASYCRCVSSGRYSNEKKKGQNNRKNGNAYLSWAYLEAANFAKRHYPAAQAFYQRKMTKTNKIVAIKALAHKLARASYFVIKDETDFNPQKLFG